eukprot:gene23921-17948_t
MRLLEEYDRNSQLLNDGQHKPSKVTFAGIKKIDIDVLVDPWLTTRPGGEALVVGDSLHRLKIDNLEAI